MVSILIPPFAYSSFALLFCCNIHVMRVATAYVSQNSRGLVLAANTTTSLQLDSMQDGVFNIKLPVFAWELREEPGNRIPGLCMGLRRSQALSVCP